MAADDALGLFQSLRPQSPALSAEIHAARSGGPPGTPDLHSLAMVPGTPGYNSRIPRPPCHQCGEDHLPNHDYGHAWVPEPVHDEPVSATAIMNRPAPDIVQAPVAVIPQNPQRVTLYVGRGDTYVIAVEAAPEWDAVHTFKVEPDMVLAMINLARALNVKVSDKTGGDLLMLEQEHGWSKPAPPDERDTEGVRDRQPRRQGRGAARPQEDQPG